jgi:hypothetical protein
MLLQLIARAAWEYEQRIVMNTWEFVAVPILLILFILIGFNYTLRNKKNKLIQKYFFKGLLFKLFGVVFFCLIYLYYYGGGDTINYFESSMAFAKLFYKNPQHYFEVVFSKPSIESFFLFDDSTGFPWSYMYFESTTCMVVKITSFFTIITARSYLLTSLLIAFITYFGVWKLFQLFCQYSPRIENRLAWAILYFPSPLFWGSGVSKDTFTYFGTVLFVYSAHEFFIKKNRSVAYFSLLIFGVWLILNIKPYILLVLLPGGLLWLFYNKLVLVKNKLLLLILFPIILVAVVGISFFILGQLGDNMSKFSLDNALNTASATNYDLKQSYYKGSSFNIGDFDGTIVGMIKLLFPAINAGLFRPYLWESNSAVLFLAGIENFLLLTFTIYILFKTKIIGTFKIIFKDPILLFCIMFSVLFAFMIGLTTSNFGALVRFKIPLIPFFVSALFIIYDRYKFGTKK